MPIHARKLPSDAHDRLAAMQSPVPHSIPPVQPDEAEPPRARLAGGMPEDDRRPRTDVPHVTDIAGDGTDAPWYRKERWLAVQLSALVPILGAMLVPAAYRVALCMVGAALIATGTIMMLRHRPTESARVAGSGEPS